MRTLSWALLLGLLLPAAAPADKKPQKVYSLPLPAPANFSALEWLLGDWTGKTLDPGPSGQVHLSVAYDLNKQVLVFREEVQLNAGGDAPATHESWLGILRNGDSQGNFILRTYSSTGFATRYRVTVSAAQVRFTPEGGDQPPPGWLFRRVLTRSGPDELTETVEASPPGEAFFNFYVARLQHPPVSPPTPPPSQTPPKP